MSDDQMIFLPGPRRVGKTTISLKALEEYNHGVHINWDSEEGKELIQQGYKEILKQLNFEKTYNHKPLVIFDEIHKFSRWQSWIKGFYDEYHKQLRIIVTGSAKLDLYKAGGDSLMGRYFLYHIHPFTVAELLGRSSYHEEIGKPVQLDRNLINRLLNYGGFLEPFIKIEKRFYNRWVTLRKQQLFTREIRDLTNIQEIAQLELLARVLSEQIGKTTSFSTLARKVQVSDVTIKRWL